MIRSLLVVLLLLSGFGTAIANNIGFESNSLANWTASSVGSQSSTNWSGDGVGVSVVTGITNYQPGGGKTWTVTPYGTYMASVQPGAGSVGFDSMTTSLGLTPQQNQSIRSMLTTQAQIGGGNPTPTNAAWIRRDVTLQAGVTYVYAWQYLSTDYTPFNDGSIMTLVNSVDPSKTPTLNNSVSNYALLGFTNPGTGNYATDSYGSTGWQLAVFTVPVDGVYTLGFAAFNLGDTILSPILLIDEQQGTTTLNGQSFAPIPPNSGSSAPTTPTAPTLCCGGSNQAFDPNPVQVNRVEQFNNRSSQDSQVWIEQIGNNNTITVEQTGTRNNYARSVGVGSNNTVTVTQSASNNTTSNYTEVSVTGNQNVVEVTQSGTGNKSAFVTANNNNNTVSVVQRDGGNHWASVSVSGGDKSVSVTQEGGGSHRADISLSGGPTGLTLTQSGNNQQHYSIEHNCSGVCQPITVIQGQ